MTAAVVITTVFAIPTEGNVYANDTTYEMTEGSLYDVEESVTEVGEKLKADSETDFDYCTSSLNGQNGIYIYGYHGKRSEITIPEQINGKDVIYIDYDIYYNGTASK